MCAAEEGGRKPTTCAVVHSGLSRNLEAGGLLNLNLGELEKGALA